MQTGKSFFRESLLCLALLVIFPSFSWAASSFKADTSGFCCADNSLKESSEQQCKKIRGIYYPAKEKVTAQKECRSQKGNIPRKAGISAKMTVSGFCCVDGVVKRATPAQCSKVKGSFYKSSAEARKGCKPKDVFCCIDGKVSEISASQCKKRKGAAYKSAAEAKKKCKPADVYCCIDGKIKKTSPQQCKQQKGTAYATISEAKRKCKPADIYCCVDGSIRKMSSKQCRSRKGKESRTRIEADRVCRQERSKQKNPTMKSMNGAKSINTKVGKTPRRGTAAIVVGSNGYCCSDGKVSRQNKKECERKKGDYFTSRINAEKACRAKKAGVTAGTEKSRQNNPISRDLNAKPTTGSGGLFAETRGKNKGDQQPVVINRDGKFDASGALVVVPAGLAVASNQGKNDQIAQITDRDITLSGRLANWSVVSGRVVATPSSTQVPLVGQVAATLVGSPSPESSERYITAAIENGEYRMLLPPNSNWEVNVLPAMAFNFEELPRGAQVFTYASRSELTRNFALTYAVEQNFENTQTCRVNGSVLIDGEPAENFSMRVFEAVTQGFSTVFRDFPAEGNRFTLFVPPGDYHLKPMFRADSPDFNLIQPKDFTCDFNERHHIIVNFNTNRAQRLGASTGDGTGLADEVVTSPIGDAVAGIDADLAVIKGRVTVNGQAGYRSILRVRLEKMGAMPREMTELRPDPRGGYQFAVVPDGARYRLGVIVEEGLGFGGDSRTLDISPGASTQTHNFDIQFPEFQIDPQPIALRTAVQENGSKRYHFDLKTVASPNPGDKVYSREVSVSTNNSGVTHKRSCDFGSNTTCSFTLPAVQITEQDTMLIVTISHELPGASDSSIEIPLTLDRVSDLIVDKITLIEERPRQGSGASGYSTLKDIQVKILNIGGAPSATPCPVGLSLNGTLLNNSWELVERLETDRYQSLLWQVEELGAGDVITVEIADQCDTASGNNHYRHIVQAGGFRFRRN